MLRRPLSRRRLGLLVLLLLVPGAARAGSLTVSPTRVELTPDRRAASVSVRNDGGEPVMVQVQAFGWPGSPATEDLVPTRELVAVPPVATIPPGESQLIRVATRGAPPADVESAFRLLISEVPPEPSGAARAGVRFVLRLSLPVFVTPSGAAAEPAWSLEPAGAASPRRLVLANRGTAHVQVRRIRVLAPGRDGTAAPAAAAHTIDEAAYVLPGQRHGWTLPLSWARAPLEIVADTDLGELEATVPAPGG